VKVALLDDRHDSDARIPDAGRKRSSECSSQDNRILEAQTSSPPSSTMQQENEAQETTTFQLQTPKKPPEVWSDSKSGCSHLEKLAILDWASS
jgi:hypothetical protein